jgi:hypothetical protein
MPRNTYAVEEPPWLFSESASPLSSAYATHVLLTDLTFKQYMRFVHLHSHSRSSATSAAQMLDSTPSQRRRTLPPFNAMNAFSYSGFANASRRSRADQPLNTSIPAGGHRFGTPKIIHSPTPMR